MEPTGILMELSTKGIDLMEKNTNLENSTKIMEEYTKLNMIKIDSSVK